MPILFFRSVLRAILFSRPVLRAPLLPCLVLRAVLLSRLFCAPFSLFCIVLRALLISRLVLRVLRRFPLHVDRIAWFSRCFVFSLAFAYRAVMLTAWSSHELGFAWFGTQTA